MSYWAIAQTEPQREHIARVLLMRAGYETYAPRIKQQGRIQPLFPTYLFVRIIERWYPVLWTIGVSRMLMAGESPAALREDVVPLLRKRERGGLVRLPTPEPKFKRGQQVKIIRGALEGQLGLFEGQSGRDRVCVLLGMLGSSIVELPAADVVTQNLAS